MLWLYVQAPFAVFRTFAAGSFRPTATFISPSAAFGLLLNVAAIESRRDDGRSAMTLTDTKALEKWRCSIALGAVSDSSDRLAQVHSMFQQLHNYPVGSSGKEHAPATKGNKYNITPVRREFLSGLCALIVVKDNDALSDRIRRGLSGEFNSTRYGLPFLGDNAFLPDVMSDIGEPRAARWYARVSQSDEGIIEGTTRLTTWIDRADMSRTRSHLFAPGYEATSEIPDGAWTKIAPIE